MAKTVLKYDEQKYCIIIVNLINTHTNILNDVSNEYIWYIYPRVSLSARTKITQQFDHSSTGISKLLQHVVNNFMLNELTLKPNDVKSCHSN